MQNKYYALIYCIEFLVIEGRSQDWYICFDTLGLPAKSVLKCYVNGTGKKVSFIWLSFLVKVAVVTMWCDNIKIILAFIFPIFNFSLLLLLSALVIVHHELICFFPPLITSKHWMQIDMQLQLSNGYETAHLNPPHTSLPWVVVNDQPLGNVSP